MNENRPSWPIWERRKQSGLVVIAAVVSGLIAWAPQNERRMFVLPTIPSALAAIPAPEGTALRAPITGSLDPCAPGNAFVRAVTGDRCARPRRRTPTPGPSPAAEPQPAPVAFFSAPDDPLEIDSSPLVYFHGIDPIPTDLPVIGRNPFSRPIRFVGAAPPALVIGVPEPASWAMIIAGFAAIGACLRRRARRHDHVGAV